ncbi:DUF4123 domain-containing protein [Phyllobacterium sp. OV277]|uniref:DUF4123 domain-containing protein n=1 Tax=Phyllobacterium sp. OV277 TaxID=1882772 RepID=UPI000881C2E5|nr:DUF4123 domain-containing protein [Phyllobacterium sp. OV277]SDP37478.1 protein of unknown function [Phyllobacterium sp. OV277]
MEKPLLETPDSETKAHVFRAVLDGLPRPLFAVLDGGHFDDLEDELADVGITSRSLFLRGGEEAMRRDGPLLVALNDRKTREHIEELVLEKPCAVFWSCPEGEQALWRHLRTINEVLIPDTRFPNNDGRSGKSGKYERVLFRHWDPNVFAPILRLLDVQQFARLFGPAQSIFMNAIGDSGLTRVPRPENLPKMPKGMLTIDADQLKAVETRHQTAYCRRMSAILREMAPHETAGMSEQELNDRVLRYEASGNKLGLTQERSLSIWGFMMIASGDRIENQPEIQKYLRSGPDTPDQNVETLLYQMTRLTSSIEEVI